MVSNAAALLCPIYSDAGWRRLTNCVTLAFSGKATGGRRGQSSFLIDVERLPFRAVSTLHLPNRPQRALRRGLLSTIPVLSLPAVARCRSGDGPLRPAGGRA